MLTAGAFALVLTFATACGVHRTAAQPHADTAMTPVTSESVVDTPKPFASLSANPPLFPPVESLECGPDAKGVNLSAPPYGTGSDTPPAKLARREAKQVLLDRFPELRQRLVYQSPQREDYVFEEPDGTPRGYFIYIVQQWGGWISNGSAYC